MNELSTQERQLPDTLEDLSKFVLVGREKLNAVRAEIRAIKAVELAAEVHEQKLEEAQEIAEAVLDAEAKLGELTKQMERAQGFASIHPNGGENVKTKTEQLKELGINHHERFETLANHPEQIERAKTNAREQGKIVTRQDVFNEINAENENRRQQEARELREAKKRAEEFEENKQDKVVSFSEAKQNDTDNEKLFEAFNREFENMIDAVRKYAGMATDGRLEKEVRRAGKYDLRRMADHASELYRSALKIQRAIMEVVDEE